LLAPTLDFIAVATARHGWSENDFYLVLPSATYFLPGAKSMQKSRLRVATLKNPGEVKNITQKVFYNAPINNIAHLIPKPIIRRCKTLTL